MISLKSRLSKIVFSVIAFSIFLFMTTMTFGQSGDQGRIVGRVLDPAGAVIPGATVKVKSVRTGEERTVTTNGDGAYIVTALKASLYAVTATATNFGEAKINDVQLSVGQELTLDISLKVGGNGAVGEVNVTYQSEDAIDTSSASMSATVNQREVESLPVNGRQLSQLYLQAPGSVNSGSGTFGDIRFSGRAVQQNVIRYDGVEGTAIIDASPGNLNGEVPSPFRLQSSLENVQEFRVESNNFPAEFGTGTGGQITVVTKSGSNQLHGSVFEYFRNDKLDARNFFDNIERGIPKSILRLNQFGGSIGGPIVKDKFFFFGSYEGYRVRSGLNFIEGVPSAAARARAVPSIVPFLDAFKSPQAVLLSGSLNPDFDLAQLQDTARTDENSFAARFDYKINAANSVYVRYFRDQGKDNRPEGVSGRRVNIEAVPQNAVFAYQSLFGNFINEFKIGYNGARTRINGTAPTINGLDLSAVTINVTGSVANSGIAGQGNSAGISIPGGLVRANSATNGRGQPYTPYSLGFIDSLNWARGDHNIKFGGEIRAIRLYTDRLGGTTYSFTNLNAFLANTPSTVQYLGDVSAPSPFNGGATGERLAKQEYFIVYGQDEWKIRPNLTLNYGLRYEYYTPLREDRNLQVLFDIRTGALRPSTEDAYRTSKNNFGPRISIAWQPRHDKTGFFSGGRTTLRGGFGIYYGPGQTEDQIQPIESDRVSSTITSGALLAFPANIPGIVANFNNNPLNRQYQPRAYSSDYLVPEKVYQYSVSVQQELPYNMVLTVGYVGSQGRNLFLRSVANKILPGQTTITDGTALPAGVGVINRVDGTGRVIGVNTVREFDILNGTTQNRPFAEVDYKTSGGDDSYNALQTSLSRRMSNGLTLNAQYTFARSFGNTAGSNEARTSGQLDNFEADRGYNNFDVRHTFNLSAIYALPIGKGKRFDLGSVGNFVLGGWDVGGIVNARSGLPIEVLVVRPDVVIQCTNALAGCVAGEVRALPATINAASPLPAGFTAVINTPGGGNSRNIRRPNLIPGVSPYLNNDRNLLNPAAFSIPAPGQFGNLPRNALRGPNFRQFDLVLAKRFRFTETVNLEFRTEVFNIFNMTNFAAPSATLNNALPALQPNQPFTQTSAGATFGLLRSTVERTVGLGTNRQIQFALRLNF